MELIDRYDASDVHDGRTIYTVKLDNGQTVDVMRKHFTGLLYVMEPHPKCNEKAVIRFVRENGPEEDFIMPAFERQTTISFAPVVDVCYSIEQAIYLAEKEWRKTPDPKAWQVFRIRSNKKILKDWLSPTEKNK